MANHEGLPTLSSASWKDDGALFSAGVLLCSVARKYTSEAARKQHLRKTEKTLKKVSFCLHHKKNENLHLKSRPSWSMQRGVTANSMSVLLVLIVIQ
jgi:hypothetical protein